MGNLISSQPILSCATIASIARTGDLTALKLARQNEYPWDEWTCSNAAKGGHLEVLQWARENGCPWNERTCRYAIVEAIVEAMGIMVVDAVDM